MRTIHHVHPQDFTGYNTQKIRENFLLDGLVKADEIVFTYTHYDRMMIGAAHPVQATLELPTYEILKAPHFLTRRELGVVSIAGTGTVTVDGEAFELEKLDVLYVGKGDRKVTFSSNDAAAPAKFILFSCPAHATYPTTLKKAADASPVSLGTLANNNERTINKYIYADGIQSCQLVLGLTNFKEGSIWNTMPAHTHDRRMEAYFYFNLDENQRVIHFMGEPQETRHLFIKNEEGIVSPAWSIHSGTATGNYSFIWAMCGENKAYDDMDFVNVKDLL
jgi:4-deoxy-L-threo-5-hexosulose-uronate ketol-isomerase